MKRILDFTIPRYKDNDFNELWATLDKILDPRAKAPIIISLSYIHKTEAQNQMFTKKMYRELNNSSNNVLVFGNKTVSMITAFSILDNNPNSYRKVKNEIAESWSLSDIDAFNTSLKTEGFNFDE